MYIKSLIDDKQIVLINNIVHEYIQAWDIIFIHALNGFENIASMYNTNYLIHITYLDKVAFSINIVQIIHVLICSRKKVIEIFAF